MVLKKLYIICLMLVCVGSVYSFGEVPEPQTSETITGGDLAYEGQRDVEALNGVLFADDEFDDKRKKRDVSKRAAGTRLIKEWTVYRRRGDTVVYNVTALCTSAHNFLRRGHKRSPKMVYDEEIARQAEKWAIHLTENGLFEHDSRIGGKYGENLYRNDNTYQLKANPVHAVAAWYAESWVPNGQLPKNYDYNFNPKTSEEFQKSGVGHFTQLVWDESVQFGCGAAFTTYMKDNFQWTQVVIVTRYFKPGNRLGSFPDHIRPPRRGAGSLNNLKKSRLYPRLYPVRRGCINTLPPETCQLWQQQNWCDKSFAKIECPCLCKHV